MLNPADSSKEQTERSAFFLLLTDCACRDPVTWQKVKEVQDLLAGILPKIARRENKDYYLALKRILELYNELEVKLN